MMFRPTSLSVGPMWTDSILGSHLNRPESFKVQMLHHQNHGNFHQFRSEESFLGNPPPYICSLMFVGKLGEIHLFKAIHANPLNVVSCCFTSISLFGKHVFSLTRDSNTLKSLFLAGSTTQHSDRFSGFTRWPSDRLTNITDVGSKVDLNEDFLWQYVVLNFV